MDRKTTIPSPHYSLLWPIRMAWRDSRRSKGKLLLFILAISMGIAALTGITSFRENLLSEIDDQAKTLIGADIEVRGNEPLPDSLLHAFSSRAPEMSRETYFASMVYFPGSDGTRLAQVRALDGKFPYYGNIQTVPEDAARTFQSGKYALVDEKMMIQYNVVLGDSVRVGSEQFKIIGRLQRIPGQTEIGSTAAPVVYIPYNFLNNTDLLQKGSRVNYLTYFQFSADTDTAGWNQLVHTAAQKGFRIDDVKKRKEETGRAFKDLSGFLELVAFSALLLGCLGVASSMYVYTKEKTAIVATLRCLGMKSGQAITIFLIQVAIFGFIGSMIGVLLGTGLHLYLPVLVKDFIPVTLTPSFSWLSAGTGLLTGILVSLLFALLSLVSLRRVSPLQAIRSGSDPSAGIDWWQLAIAVFILLFMIVLVYLQIDSWAESAVFCGGLVGLIALLGLLGKGLVLLIRQLVPAGMPYVWRQGLSNLYRPHNQTTLLIITLGLGTAFMGTLLFMQNMLVERVSIAGAADRPNTVLFDIQSSQKEEVRMLVKDYELPVLQEVPIVTMRLLEINGITMRDAKADTTLQIPSWAYDREYRVTYRDSLIDSETISEGIWTGHFQEPSDTIWISVSTGYAENLHLTLGDELIFNVQGARIKTYVGSFREVDWTRMQTNFIVLFPTGVLEQAPQFYVLITRVQNNEVSARFQQAVVRSYPNISIIDLELVLQTLEDILGKIAFVIRFMAFFSIGTGLLMLISAILLSRFQRVRENVLLRTLGASGSQLWKIIFAEYFFLGLLGAISGVLLAVLITSLLGTFLFDFSFVPGPGSSLLLIAGVTALTVGIGLLNSRSVVRQSPLEVLRKES